MTAEVKVPSEGGFEGVEKVGGECNGDAKGSYVLVTGNDGVGVGESGDFGGEADLGEEHVVASVEKDGVNGNVEVMVENGGSEGGFEGVEKVGGDCNGDAKGSYVLVTGNVIVGESGDFGDEADLSEEHVVGSVEKDSVNGNGEVMVENGGCIVEGDGNGVALEEEEESGQRSVADSSESGEVGSEEPPQGSIVTAEFEGLPVHAAVADGEQNGTVVSEEQAPGSVVCAGSEGLDEQNEEVVFYDQAECEEVVGAAVADCSAAGEQSVEVVSKELEQGSIGAESEEVLVDVGDVGSSEQMEESVDVVEDVCDVTTSSEVSKALASDVTYCACGDCKAPHLDPIKMGDEESKSGSAGQVQDVNAIVSKEPLLDDEKVEDEGEIHLNSTEQIEESQESGTTLKNSVEPELCQLSRGVEQDSLVVNGGFTCDHPERESAYSPIADVANEAEGGLNSEAGSANSSFDTDSSMPKEACENSCEDSIEQPTDADAVYTDNVLVEVDTVDVDTRNVEDVECASLANIETGNLAVDGETLLVETTSEFAAEVPEESKKGVDQVAAAKTSENGETQLVEATSKLVEETIEGSENEVALLTKSEVSEKVVEAGDGGFKNELKPDIEATDIQRVEPNSKPETVESIETSDISNVLVEAESVNEPKAEAAELETKVGEMDQPADADSESFCPPSGPPVEKRPFHFMIRIPRFDDEKLREEIELAQLNVDEKTKLRDAIMSEVQSERIICRGLRKTFQDFVSEQKKVRDAFGSKRQEIDSQQLLVNKVRDAMSVEDIDERMRNMKHMIEHESLPLKVEKQYVREIEKLKQTREDLSSNMGRQDEVQHALEPKEQIEKQLKLLRKEADVLREELRKVQYITTTAKKKLDDQNDKLQQLEAAYRNADKCRQQEYSRLQSLWGTLNEKNKYFRKYRDDVKAAYNYALVDREALQQHCVNQVESFMELWNKNDEFRKEYVKCNLRSTLKRLRTHDGRSLGPDEEPPIIPNAIRTFNKKTPVIVSTPEKEQVNEAPPLPLQSEKSENANNKVMEVKTQMKAVPDDQVLGENVTVTMKPDPVVSISTSVSGRTKIEESSEEVTKVVEDEMSREAEKIRKEEDVSRLEEQLRLEQKAKAKEALERKKRLAEKAQARAELRAKREQEKRDRKMEKKKAAVVEIVNGTNDVEHSTKETTAVTTKEPEHQEKPSVVTKRSSKPLQYTKSKAIPPPLRNRSKRRMQSWMWFLLIALLVFALFLLGSSDILSKLGLQKLLH